MSSVGKQSSAFPKIPENPLVGNPEQMRAVSQAGEFISKFMTQANAEAFNFVSKRLAEDFALPSKLASCKTPADLAETQMKFFEKMVSDYSTETQKMWGMTLQAVQNGNYAKSGPSKNGSSHSRARASSQTADKD